MLFPAHDLVGTYARDRWLIKLYRPPTDGLLTRRPASLLPGGITYIDHRSFAPKELIAEVDQAYFRRALREEVSLWLTRHGVDSKQRAIPRHLFEAAVQAEFGQLLPDVEPVRYTDDDLVIKGVKGIGSNRWANPSQAAKALADLATGASHEANVDRLRKKIRAALDNLDD
jgi:hypothetical protein